MGGTRRTHGESYGESRKMWGNGGATSPRRVGMLLVGNRGGGRVSPYSYCGGPSGGWGKEWRGGALEAWELDWRPEGERKSQYKATGCIWGRCIGQK